MLHLLAFTTWDVLSVGGGSGEYNHFDTLDGFPELLQLLFDVLVVGLQYSDFLGLAAIEPACLHLGNVLGYVCQFLVLLSPTDTKDIADALAQVVQPCLPHAIALLRDHQVVEHFADALHFGGDFECL